VATAENVGESEGLNATPIWFGPTDLPLFGWLHLPQEANAGVVLCRPIGLEALSAYRTYRCLAEKLADKGVVTLQFDYTGTGDSAGDPADVVGIGTWLADISSAIDFVRNTGVSRVGLVGLRLGATLAAKAAADNDVEALVLWDPCETGRGFLREQRMLAVAIGAEPGGDPASVEGVEIPGLLLPEDLAETIRALRLDDSACVLAPRLLLLTRPERPSSENLRKQLSTHNVECRDAVGQAQFIDVEPGAAVLPQQAITDIVSWLSQALDCPAVRTRVRFHPETSPTAIVARSTADRSIIERTVRIGTENLFGIVTEPQKAELSSMPAVVFVNAGLLPHSGPARLWVEMARSWAAQGVRVLRVDLGGLGDSPTRQGRQPDVVYPAEAIEDVVDAARFIAPEDPEGVVLVGLCSGGYHALEGALLLNSRRAWLINPGLPLVPPELTERGVVDWRRQALPPLNSLARRLLANDRIAHLSAAITPTFAWWVLDRLQLYPSSARALETLARRGTELLVILSEPQFSLLAERERWAVRRLERSGQCHFEVIKSMDHSVFNLSGRSELMKLFTAQVRERLVPEFRTPDARARTEGSSAG
jgi:dienelactone hydrolase